MSKIDMIVEGNPYNVTAGHLGQIKRKLVLIDILNWKCNDFVGLFCKLNNIMYPFLAFINLIGNIYEIWMKTGKNNEMINNFAWPYNFSVKPLSSASKTEYLLLQYFFSISIFPFPCLTILSLHFLSSNDSSLLNFLLAYF